MWNRALPVDCGMYTITGHAPGANAWSAKVTVAAETVDVSDLRNLAPNLAQAKRDQTGSSYEVRRSKRVPRHRDEPEAALPRGAHVVGSPASIALVGAF